MKSVTNNELLEMDIEELPKLDRSTIKEISYLKGHGFQTIGDLISCFNEQQREYLLKIDFWDKYFNLRLKLMNRGIVISDDLKRFKNAKIKIEDALIIIDDIKLPAESKSKIVNFLKRMGIYFLGDLLTTHYGAFNNMDDICLIDLKKYIHSLGYVLPGEKLTKTEIKQGLKKQGKMMIDEVLTIPKHLSNVLAEEGIYTVEKLLELGFVVILSILHGDSKLINTLVNAMALKGFYFNECNINQAIIDNEKLKNIPIEVLILYGLSNYDFGCIQKLKNAKINTISDLISANTNYIYKLLKGNHALSPEYWSIREALIRMGLLFDDNLQEFKNRGIKKEIALVSVRSMNITQPLKNTLIKNGIQCLGDILTTDYIKLSNCRGMGEKIVELKKYIHSIGFVIQNEQLTKKEEQALREREGIKTAVEELGLSKNVAAVLNINGIVTIDDLLAHVPDIFYAKRIGMKMRNELKEAMRNYGLEFTDPYENESDNVEIQKLLLELETLNNERQSLLSKYKELGKVINIKRKNLKALRNPKVKVLNYDEKQE